ncbi:MAG: serine hydrolase [Okeania sp. SIO3B3]|nr:serine hydrolase [Okeania sp. SIO3B3]
MLKKNILISLGILITVVLLLGISVVYYFKPNKELILNFIQENPSRSSIKLVRNDRILADLNSDIMMPLASTVKIILAIEYAEQAAVGLVNPDEEIELSELDKFYVKNTDGEAHPNWLKSVNDKIKYDKISIREIVKGMLKYSSNANTEWLSQKLGLDNINNKLKSLGIKKHSEIYYIVSALFVGKEKSPNLKGKKLEQNLRELKIDDYIKTTDKIHQKLLTETTYKNDIGDLGLNIQKIWSDNLPGSTTFEYVEVMKKINSRTYFSEKTQKYLDEVMEWVLDNPVNQKWLEHSGMKGGSTAFVLTKALYATDKEGNKTEMAYFFNDLGIIENTRLQISMNEFDLNILTSPEFRDKVKTKLMN